jgi:subtilisin family serine protease
VPPSREPWLKFLVKGLFLLNIACLLPLAHAADGPPYVPGRLLVGHREGVDPAVQDRILKLHGAALRRHIPQLAVSVLDVPERSSEATIASLQRTGLFTYVERDYYAHTAAVPNDPSYGSQWYLPRIHSPQAWGITTGAASVVIAVIDSGVDSTHPDLASKLVAGWNFVGNNADTSDVLGHGTAVAGTVAAASNNNIGVAGVSWDSRIMPLLVVDQNDFATYSDMAAAMQYAADHGVRIINISVGGTNMSYTLQNAVDYAWNKGAVIFAAAMNASGSAPYYPAGCNHVVSVSATDTADHLASFSDYGNWITLSAPGTSILTTMNHGGYGYWSGTSFSAPITAGVAALCLAVNPALTNASLVSILKQTADDLGDPGYDTSFGWGRLNAYNAVSAVSQTVAPAAPAPAPAPVASPANPPTPPNPRHNQPNSTPRSPRD